MSSFKSAREEMQELVNMKILPPSVMEDFSDPVQEETKVVSGPPMGAIPMKRTLGSKVKGALAKLTGRNAVPVFKKKKTKNESVEIALSKYKNKIAE